MKFKVIKNIYKYGTFPMKEIRGFIFHIGRFTFSICWTRDKLTEAREAHPPISPAVEENW